MRINALFLVMALMLSGCNHIPAPGAITMDPAATTQGTMRGD